MSESEPGGSQPFFSGDHLKDHLANTDLYHNVSAAHDRDPDVALSHLGGCPRGHGRLGRFQLWTEQLLQGRRLGRQPPAGERVLADVAKLVTDYKAIF